MDGVTRKIEHFLRALMRPSNVMEVPDAKYGQRTINLTIRLDEFNFSGLVELLPELQALFRTYIELRLTERRLLEQYGGKLPPAALTGPVMDDRFNVPRTLF